MNDHPKVKIFPHDFSGHHISMSHPHKANIHCLVNMSDCTEKVVEN